MRVVVADDVMLMRAGIVGVLTREGIEVVREAGDVEALMRAVKFDKPDVAITDIRMPPTQTDEGLVAAQEIRRLHPAVGVLVLSQFVEAAYAMQLLDEGPGKVGYLLKERVSEGRTLVDALERIDAGETVIDQGLVQRLIGRRRQLDPLEQLSTREREVLELIAEGLSNSAIGSRLFVTERTVEAHVKQILGKLQIPADTSSNRRVLAVLTLLRA